MMNHDVEALAGPKGKHDPNRTAYRHGSQAATIPSYEAFASDDRLLEAALNRMLYGMST